MSKKLEALAVRKGSVWMKKHRRKKNAYKIRLESQQIIDDMNEKDLYRITSFIGYIYPVVAFMLILLIVLLFFPYKICYVIAVFSFIFYAIILRVHYEEVLGVDNEMNSIGELKESRLFMEKISYAEALFFAIAIIIVIVCKKLYY